MNFFLLKNYLFLIFNKNLNTYKKILLFYNTINNYQLLYSFRFRYLWLESYNDFNKFYYVIENEFFFTDFFFNNVNIVCDSYNNIHNIIEFKNKINLFKNNQSIKNNYINKINNMKFDNLNLNLSDFDDATQNEFNVKHFEFIEKKLHIYKHNRIFFKQLFNLNKKIKKFLNKFFKKLIKLKSIDFYNFFECSLINILLNSNFFLSKKDIIFFIKSGFIYVNNKVSFNLNHVLKENDVLNVCYNKYYFFIYRRHIEKFNNTLNRFNNLSKFHEIKEDRFNREFKFMNNVYIINGDIPDYIEVDYLTMSLVLLNKINFNYEYNCFNLKFINLFLRRLYNWKYII